MASSEIELLQTILKEIKDIKAEVKYIKANFLDFKQSTQQNFTELRTDIKFTHSVLGQLQGDIEEIQADTQYLAMRRLIDKKRLHGDSLLQRSTPKDDR